MRQLQVTRQKNKSTLFPRKNKRANQKNKSTLFPRKNKRANQRVSTVTDVLSVAFSGSEKDIVASIVESWNSISNPISRTDDGEPKLKGPDKRMSLGIAKRNENYMLALLVEKKGSWAWRKAKELQERHSSHVIVEVTGILHSARPENKIPVEPQKKLSPGVSIGHYRGYPGTLGCFVNIKAGSTNWRGIVGSSHVLSMNNTAKKNDPILHPGWPDGFKTSSNIIGKLTAYSVLGHYQDDTDAPNEEDIAVIKPDDPDRLPSTNLVPNPRDPNKRIRLKGYVPANELYKRIGEKVYKIGRTTKFTEGTLNVTNIIEYYLTLPNGRKYRYHDLASVEPAGKGEFSRDGDSGSIVYTEDGLGIGLIVGGSLIPSLSFFIPLSSCLTSVNAELI